MTLSVRRQHLIGLSGVAEVSSAAVRDPVGERYGLGRRSRGGERSAVHQDPLFSLPLESRAHVTVSDHVEHENEETLKDVLRRSCHAHKFLA